MVAVEASPRTAASQPAKSRAALVIRVAGEAGEGLKKPGEMLTQAATRAGFQLLTDVSPPSEIKGVSVLPDLSRQPFHHAVIAGRAALLHQRRSRSTQSWRRAAS